jgi:hypothetical protein
MNHIQASAAGRKSCGNPANYFQLSTPSEVTLLLERFRRLGKEVRIFFGDPNTGRDDLEEDGVLGFVSRAADDPKVSILLENGETWGEPILTHRIVKLMDAKDRSVLWEHPSYKAPRMVVVPGKYGRGFSVNVDGKSYAGFNSKPGASKWVMFMNGTSMIMPD